MNQVDQEDASQHEFREPELEDVEVLARDAVQQYHLADESIEHDNHHQDREQMRVLSIAHRVVDHWPLTHNGKETDACHTAEVTDNLNEQDRVHNFDDVDLRIFFVARSTFQNVSKASNS